MSNKRALSLFLSLAMVLSTAAPLPVWAEETSETTVQAAENGMPAVQSVPNAPVLKDNSASKEGKDAWGYDHSVRITWTAPDDNGSPITEYVIKQDGEEIGRVGGDTFTYTAENLENGLVYNFCIAAVNANGVSQDSNVIQAQPNSAGPDVSRPGGSGGGNGQGIIQNPLAVQLTNLDTYTGEKKPVPCNLEEIWLQFTHNVTSNGMAQANSELVTLTKQDSPEDAVKLSPYYIDTTVDFIHRQFLFFKLPKEGLSPNTTYSICIADGVLANNGHKTEKPQFITFTTEAGAPAAPVLHLQPGADSITLKWTKPSGNGSPITGYSVQQDGVTIAEALPADQTEYVVEGLTAGQQYTFTLTAVNALGSAVSQEVKGTPGNLEVAKLVFTGLDTQSEIVVLHDGLSVKQETDGSFLLNISDKPYFYTVKTVGYQTVQGQLVVNNGETRSIAVALTKLEVWSGAAATKAPVLTDGVYQITSAEELAWLAGQVNSGKNTLNAALTRDIVLSDSTHKTDWTPIGNKDYPYMGTFNGGGHRIIGLYMKNTEPTEQGLFGYVGEKGMIMGVLLADIDLHFEGGSSNYGALVGNNGGVIRYCGAESGTLTAAPNGLQRGSSSMGGLVGWNDYIIESCFNAATVDCGTRGRAAGIAGSSEGQIRNCSNFGHILSPNVQAIAYGNRHGNFANCYNGGMITKYNRGAENTLGHSVGQWANSVENCYFLAGTAMMFDGQLNGTEVTAEQVRTLSDKLGSAFVNDAAGNLKLRWQNPAAVYTIELTVEPANAVVSLTRGGQSIQGTVSGAVHTFADLPVGDYEYKISCEDADYEVRTGTISILNGSVQQKVALEFNTYALVLHMEPKDASVTLKQGGSVVEDGVIDAQTGTAQWMLPNGTYQYEVQAYGHAPVTGEVTIDKQPVEETIQLKQVGSGTVRIQVAADEGLTFRPEGAPVITVTSVIGAMEQNCENGGTLTLPEGKYIVAVRASTFKTIREEIQVKENQETALSYTMVFDPAWDGVYTSQPKQNEAGAYLITNGYELAWFRDQINAQTEQCKIYGLDAILMADIDLGGYLWTPIGHYKLPDYNALSIQAGYSGTFDGNGHSVTGLHVKMQEEGLGLFGLLAGTAKISNLTVSGDVTGSEGGLGGIVGMSMKESMITIENCVNYVVLYDNGKEIHPNVGSSYYAGGVIGCIAGHDSLVKNCTNYAKLGVRNWAFGGVVGGMSGNKNAIEDCVNHGELLYADGRRYTGGILGIANGINEMRVDNCFNDANINEGMPSCYENIVGGIVGECSAKCTNCVNTGNVTGALQVGGIVGAANELVSNCRNTGNVKQSFNDRYHTALGLGGIVGLAQLKVIIKDCYNTGMVEQNNQYDTYVGGVVGMKSLEYPAGPVTNCYYLNGTAAEGIGQNAEQTDMTFVCSQEELNSPEMAMKLGDGFVYPKNGGAPLLAAEDPEGLYLTRFAVAPEDADVVVKLNDTAVDALAPGLYGMAKGTYQYTVSKPGYTTVNGEVAVTGGHQTVAVNMDQAVVADTAGIRMELSGDHAAAFLYLDQPYNVNCVEVNFTCTEALSRESIHGLGRFNDFVEFQDNGDGSYKLYLGVTNDNVSAQERVDIASIDVMNRGTSIQIVGIKLAGAPNDFGMGGTVTNGVDPDTAAFIGFDVDGSGKVDLVDLSTALKYYMVKSGDVDWTIAHICDFNLDTVVDGKDYTLLLNAMK